MLFDVTADCLHHLQLTIAAERSRTAPQAGPIAGLFGLIGLAEKFDIFTLRSLSWTRGPAVNAGGGDGKDELTIVSRIPSQNRFPPALVEVCHFQLLSLVEYRTGRHNEKV